MMDALANAYKKVRDATVVNDAITVAEKICVLETVKHEILSTAYGVIKTAEEDPVQSERTA